MSEVTQLYPILKLQEPYRDIMVEDQVLVHLEVQAAAQDLTVYQEAVEWVVGWEVE